VPAPIKLNRKQIDLLRWIADGCPDGVMSDGSHRISAAALRNRGLATTSGRGSSWTARLTPAGADYLANLDPPRVDEPAASKPPAWPVPQDVPVPSKVGRYHVVARDFRDRIERHEVSRARLPRATRLVQAIAVAAERRGWGVRTAGESENEVGLVDWASAKDGHLQLSVDGHPFWLRLQEEGVGTRGAFEDEEALHPYDAGGTGRLKLELRWGEWFTRQQTRWVDRANSLLEDRLADVFGEIQERVADAERVADEKQARAAAADAEAEAAAQAREHEWTRLMADARVRYIEEAYAAELLAQVEAFERVARIRAYCDAVVAAHGSGAGLETAAWISWAREHADRIDPLLKPPHAPPDVEPAPAALQSYLPEGWNAAGP
jgi:hypothetical protein